MIELRKWICALSVLLASAVNILFLPEPARAQEGSEEPDTAPVIREDGSTRDVPAAIRKRVRRFLDADEANRETAAAALRASPPESLQDIDCIYQNLGDAEKIRLRKITEEMKKNAIRIPDDLATLCPEDSILFGKVQDSSRIFQILSQTPLGQRLKDPKIRKYLNEKVLSEGPFSEIPEEVKKLIQAIWQDSEGQIVLSLIPGMAAGNIMPRFMLIGQLHDPKALREAIDGVITMAGLGKSQVPYRGFPCTFTLIGQMLFWKNLFLMDLGAPLVPLKLPVAIDALMDRKFSRPPFSRERKAMRAISETAPDIFLAFSFKALYDMMPPDQWTQRWNEFVELAWYIYGNDTIAASLFFEPDQIVGIARWNLNPRIDLGIPEQAGIGGFLDWVRNAPQPHFSRNWEAFPADTRFVFRLAGQPEMVRHFLSLPRDALKHLLDNPDQPLQKKDIQEIQERLEVLDMLERFFQIPTLQVTILVRTPRPNSDPTYFFMFQGVAKHQIEEFLSQSATFLEMSFDSGIIQPVMALDLVHAEHSARSLSPKEKKEEQRQQKISAIRKRESKKIAKITDAWFTVNGLNCRRIQGNSFLAEVPGGFLFGSLQDVNDYGNWLKAPQRKSLEDVPGFRNAIAAYEADAQAGIMALDTEFWLSGFYNRQEEILSGLMFNTHEPLLLPDFSDCLKNLPWTAGQIRKIDHAVEMMIRFPISNVTIKEGTPSQAKPSVTP